MAYFWALLHWSEYLKKGSSCIIQNLWICYLRMGTIYTTLGRCKKIYMTYMHLCSCKSFVKIAPIPKIYTLMYLLADLQMLQLTITITYHQVGTQVKNIYNHKSLLVGLYYDKKSWFRPKIKKLILARCQNHAFSIHAFSTLLRFQNNMFVRDLAIIMHFLGANGFLWMKSTS